MKKRIFLILIIIASMVIVRAFFMPWASVSTSVVRASRQLANAAEKKLVKIPQFDKVMKELKKATDTIEALGDIEIKSTVSGYDIPAMANRQGSKVAISLMQVFFEDAKGTGKKSYLVYLLPLLAVVCILLAAAGQRDRRPIIIMLITSGAISIAGLYNLKTIDLSNLMVEIVIGKGLWYILYSYLFIFFASILYLASDKRRSLTALLLFAYLLSSSFAFGEEEVFIQRRRSMVEEQIMGRGVSDKKVLDAMYEVKRHLFVSPMWKPLAYEDRPLFIGYGQTISQPYIVAYMTEAARLNPGDRVLEIGTGSGYQAAILAEIAEEVYTVEIIKSMADRAEERLRDLGYTNIKVRHGDGYQGWPEYAPFDAIIVTAAPSDIPKELLGQLKVGGRMVIPVGTIDQKLYLITKTEEGCKEEELLPVRFVPMVKGKK